MLPYHTLRQAVMQPAIGHRNYAHISGFQPHFFIELAQHRLFGIFIRLNATLRELPCLLPDTPPPKNLASAVGQHNPDIRAKTFRIDQAVTPLEIDNTRQMNSSQTAWARAIVPQFVDAGQPIGNHASPTHYLE